MCFKELHKKSAEAEKTFCKYRSALLEKKEKLFKTDITRCTFIIIFIKLNCIQ